MRQLPFLFYLFLCLSACQKTDKFAKPKSQIITYEWTDVELSTKAHFRGLSVVSDAVIWASGTGGTVIRSADSGLTWQTFELPESADLDFRDINAWDAQNAVVMSSGHGVKLFRTYNGGADWTLVYENPDTLVFYDGLDFYHGRGFAYGDPQNGKFICLSSLDSGATWTEFDHASMPKTLEKEAGFAASGTGVVLRENYVWLATGGAKVSRVFRSVFRGEQWESIDCPILGGDARGIFSLAFPSNKHGLAVGGNYLQPNDNDSIAAFTIDAGQNWFPSLIMPRGYRSCVAANEQIAICTGTNGTDFSLDRGERWHRLNDSGFNACAIGNESIWAVGANGSVASMKCLSVYLAFRNRTMK